MNIFIDQLGRKVKVKSNPKRIISLVPSITHLLYDLNLESEVVGITKFCIEPEHFLSTKKIIGGTKNPKLDCILELNPDLIIANKEENRLEDIVALESKVPVWVSDVKCMSDNLDFISKIGLCCNRELQALHLIQKIQLGINDLKCNQSHSKRPSIVYLIWKNPYMSVGQNTFIHDMLELTGFKNTFINMLRYPVTSKDEIHKLSPDFIFLSSEPYPFKESEFEEFKPFKTILVDGMAFSWFGSYVIKSFSYFGALNKQINPAL